MIGVLLLAAALTPRQEVQKECSRCHSIAVVRAQRLSREDWDTEIRKMEKQGAKLRNRAAVLEYLSTKYGDQVASSSK